MNVDIAGRLYKVKVAHKLSDEELDSALKTQSMSRRCST